VDVAVNVVIRAPRLAPRLTLTTHDCPCRCVSVRWLIVQEKRSNSAGRWMIPKLNVAGSSPVSRSTVPS
jgi:hypothetical protein